MKEEKISKEEVMALLQQHGGEIATMIVKSVQTESATLYMCGNDRVQILPIGLRRKLIHKKAFRRAFEQEFLCVEGGKVVSLFRTPWALAYFLGRCFSNDRSRKVLRKRIWIMGDRTFPGKELNALFGTRNLRELRKSHINNEIPEWFEEIDNLFVAR